MAYDEKTKAYVRRYYVFEGMSLESAAEKAEVSFATARRWKKQAEDLGDDWDRVRDAHTIAGGKVEDVAKGMLTRFVVQFGNVLEQVEQASELNAREKAELLCGLGDSFTKMTAASKRLIPEVSALAVAMETIELLANEIKQKKPDLLSDFIELLDDVEQRLQKEFK